MRKNYKKLILKFCQRNHVCQVENVGSDSVYYAGTKSYGIPGYVFDKSIDKVVLLMMWRTGAWRKVEGLRQFFLDRRGLSHDSLRLI